VLLSGNHAQIARWRREQAVKRTLERRPDLLQKTSLDNEEKTILEKLLSSKKESHSDRHKEPVK